MRKIAKVSAKYMRKNYDFMGKLTPQQQKMWFLPFLGFDYDTESKYHNGDIIEISIEDAKAFLKSSQSLKNLRTSIIKGFTSIEKAYFSKEDIPFLLKKVEKGIIYFRLTNIYIFSHFYHEQYFIISLDEISSYSNSKNQYSRTIPLLWFCLAHRHLSKDKSYWVGEFGDKQLKTALGLSKYDYLRIPAGQREFYIDYDIYECKTHTYVYWEYLEEKYKTDNYEGDFSEFLYKKYWKLRNEECSFDRWNFEHKVLLPAIEELNNGTMLKFLPQKVWKRSNSKNEKAILVDSYIGKNYTKEKDGFCVIAANNSIIDKNITNFRKLQDGKQYKFHIAK